MRLPPSNIQQNGGSRVAYAPAPFQYTQSKTKKGGEHAKTQLSQQILTLILNKSHTNNSLSSYNLLLIPFLCFPSFFYSFYFFFSKLQSVNFAGDKADSPPFSQHNPIKQLTIDLDNSSDPYPFQSKQPYRRQPNWVRVWGCFLAVVERHLEVTKGVSYLNIAYV